MPTLRCAVSDACRGRPCCCLPAAGATLPCTLPTAPTGTPAQGLPTLLPADMTSQFLSVQNSASVLYRTEMAL